MNDFQDPEELRTVRDKNDMIKGEEIIKSVIKSGAIQKSSNT